MSHLVWLGEDIYRNTLSPLLHRMMYDGIRLWEKLAISLEVDRRDENKLIFYGEE